jgi:DNA-binding MarR family transcriptional regulator
MAGRLLREIRQSKAFSSVEEEAVLNVQRTAAVLDEALVEALRPRDLSATQYNALRILRGAGLRGLSCQEIAQRMIRRDPDVTRLLDRLEKRGLIERRRSEEDRRVIVTRIREGGLRLLAALDPGVRRLPGRLLGHLGPRRLRTLVALLEEARHPEGSGRRR